MKTLCGLVFICIILVPAMSASAPVRDTLDLLVQGAEHQDAGRPVEAEHCFRQALEADPENVYAMSQLGLALLKQERRQAARLWLQRAAFAAPGNGFALVWLGVLALQEGKVEEAEQIFQEVLEHEPAHPDANYFLAVLRMNQGRTAEALALLRMAGANASEDASLHYRLARAYVKLEMPEAAVESFERVLEIAPRHGQALLGLGWVRYNLGNLQAAQRMWQRALSVEDAAIQARVSLAAAANEQAMTACARGERSTAMEHWQTALRFDPTNRAARHHLQRPSGVCTEQGGLLP